MSRITDDTLTDYLSRDEVSRSIARLCANGMATDKIADEVGRNRARKGYAVDYDEVRSITSSRLQTMEKLGILVYGNQMWKTTEKAKEILRKYFGMI